MTSSSPLDPHGPSAVRRLLAVLLGGLVGVAVVATVLWFAGPGPISEYRVVRGDTLSRIAAQNGVTVLQMREWNDIEGDLIEVGQVLVIRGAPPATASAAKPGGGNGVPSTAVPGGLTLPPERPCLPPPDPTQLGDVVGDEAVMIASQGLSVKQVEGAMQPFLPKLLGCVADDMRPDGVLTLELHVACTGRVDHVRVVDDGGLPDGLVVCAADLIRYVAFPTHDMPDGQEVGYPVSFAW